MTGQLPGLTYYDVIVTCYICNATWYNSVVWFSSIWFDEKKYPSFVSRLICTLYILCREVNSITVSDCVYFDINTSTHVTCGPWYKVLSRHLWLTGHYAMITHHVSLLCPMGGCPPPAHLPRQSDLVTSQCLIWVAVTRRWELAFPSVLNHWSSAKSCAVNWLKILSQFIMDI